MSCAFETYFESLRGKKYLGLTGEEEICWMTPVWDFLGESIFEKILNERGTSVPEKFEI